MRPIVTDFMTSFATWIGYHRRGVWFSRIVPVWEWQCKAGDPGNQLDFAALLRLTGPNRRIFIEPRNWGWGSWIGLFVSNIVAKQQSCFRAIL
jgi:hypothetical protein